MALAKGTKAILLILGLAYLVFIAIFLHQSVVGHGLATVPAFQTKRLDLPQTDDGKSLEDFARNYVKVEIVAGDGNKGK